MAILHSDFKWDFKCFLMGILNADFEGGFVWGFCMGMLNGYFKWIF